MDNPKIYSSLCAAMAEIGAIGKDSKNSQQGFMYRGVDAVMNSLQPVLIKNHIFVLPEVLEQTREERTTSKGNGLLYSILKVKYTFYADDGSSVSAVVIGEGMDSGDKASNKAMSVAFKYACFQVLCIPTEEMKDPDADTPEPSNRKAAAPKMQKARADYIDEIKQTVLMKESHRTGQTPTQMLAFIGKKFHDDAPDNIGHITEKQFAYIVKVFEKMADKVETHEAAV